MKKETNNGFPSTYVHCMQLHPLLPTQYCAIHFYTSTPQYISFTWPPLCLCPHRRWVSNSNNVTWFHNPNKQPPLRRASLQHVPQHSNCSLCCTLTTFHVLSCTHHWLPLPISMASAYSPHTLPSRHTMKPAYIEHPWVSAILFNVGRCSI